MKACSVLPCMADEEQLHRPTQRQPVLPRPVGALILDSCSWGRTRGRHLQGHASAQSHEGTGGHLQSKPPRRLRLRGHPSCRSCPRHEPLQRQARLTVRSAQSHEPAQSRSGSSLGFSTFRLGIPSSSGGISFTQLTRLMEPQARPEPSRTLRRQGCLQGPHGCRTLFRFPRGKGNQVILALRTLSHLPGPGMRGTRLRGESFMCLPKRPPSLRLPQRLLGGQIPLSWRASGEIPLPWRLLEHASSRS